MKLVEAFAKQHTRCAAALGESERRQTEMGGTSSSELHTEFSKPIVLAGGGGGTKGSAPARLAPNDVLVAPDYGDRSCANPFVSCATSRSGKHSTSDKYAVEHRR